MLTIPDVQITDQDILSARPPKEAVDSQVPYAWLTERERRADGHVDDVATVFLTNRECPFRCLMCDLWRHTTDTTVAVGDIPAQIDHALERLPPARRIKLYNSGNFFDRKAIPPADYSAIAERLEAFEAVIVENHPRLCGPSCLEFRDLLSGRLEIALGLETAHPEVLERLNKRMTLDDFRRAADYLLDAGIAVRTFILLRPPFLSEAEGVDWALRSIEFAFDAGVTCCSVIPTRSGNGIMDRLEREGPFRPPSKSSI
ncbi:MAG: radical SAM protein, partial [Rhodothermales bacterium]